MSQLVETPTKTFQSGGTISQFTRVVLSAGVLAVASALQKALGTIELDAVADDQVSVRLRTAQGTRKMIAAGAISAGAYVYGAASGKISATANTNLEGIALEAAGASGDIIEVLVIDSAVTNPVTAYSASGALTIVNGVATITKTGSLAAMTLAAPTADQEGTILKVVSQTAFAHTITATGLIDDGVTGGSKTTATFAAYAGASIELMASNLKWAVISKNAVTIS